MALFGSTNAVRGLPVGLQPVGSKHSSVSVEKHSSRLVMSAERGYKRDLKHYFAKRGVSYERDNSFHPKLAQKLVEMVPLKVGDSVLDVATGTGYVAISAAAKVGTSGAVLGVDISRTMLVQAHAKLKDHGKEIASCLFIEADIEQLDFGGPYFDCIFCSASLPYFSDLSTFFKKARGWLKRGGVFAFNTPKEPYSLTKPLLFSIYDEFSIPAVNSGPDIGCEASIYQTLQTAGFTDVKVELDEGSPTFQQVEDAKVYAEQQWQGMVSMPLVDFSAVPETVVEDARLKFVEQATQLIERDLNPQRELNITLKTYWVEAR